MYSKLCAKLHPSAAQRHNRGNGICSLLPSGDSISGSTRAHIPDGVISNTNTNVLFIFIICRNGCERMMADAKIATAPSSSSDDRRRAIKYKTRCSHLVRKQRRSLIQLILLTIYTCDFFSPFYYRCAENEVECVAS